MKTKFELIFEDDSPDIDSNLFDQSLPSNFELHQNGNKFYISIPSDEPEDKKCQFLIDRELDRYFYLTLVRIKASMVKKKVFIQHKFTIDMYDELDKNIAPQKWTYELPRQLRLWSIVTDSDDVLLKVILYFQIIELAYPNSNDYPEYTDKNIAPSPLKECKMLRNLAAHSGDASGKQQKSYCDYLGIPRLLHDPTDPVYIQIFNQKLALLQEEAKKAIEKSL